MPRSSGQEPLQNPRPPPTDAQGVVTAPKIEDALPNVPDEPAVRIRIRASLRFGLNQLTLSPDPSERPSRGIPAARSGFLLVLLTSTTNEDY